MFAVSDCEWVTVYCRIFQAVLGTSTDVMSSPVLGWTTSMYPQTTLLPL
jgi:hypothetical protein